MPMGCFMKPGCFSRRFLLTCPTDWAAVAVWATPGQNGDADRTWRLDGCTRLEPSHSCTEDRLKELRAQAAGYAANSRSHLAANTKSLSVSPSILCVQISMRALPQLK